MNVLITAGGSSERIDNVRSITNMSTGRLGVFLAGAFSERACVGKIFYLCGKRAELPSSEKAEIRSIETVEDLAGAVRELCASRKIDAVVHAMAVSDYTVRAVSSAAAITGNIERAFAGATAGAGADTSRLSAARESFAPGAGGEGGPGGGIALEALLNAPPYAHDGKIPSNVDDLVLFMRRTPKVLPLLRELLPGAVITAFKLLDGVAEALLIDTASRLLLENGCDFVLANDLRHIEGDRHTGHLIGRDGRRATYFSKREIADGIAGATCGLLDARGAR
jgi:phosphopantothenate-cysteine ligase